MCILKVSCSVSLTGCVGLVGIFWRVGPRTHLFVRHRCVECLAGTNMFVHFAGLGAGPVRVYLGNPLIRLAGLYGLFRLFSIVLAWVCVVKQVEGGGGGAGQYDFSSFPGFFGGSVRLKWWGVLYLNFHFLQFAVNSLGGWMCAVGILSFTFYCVL